MDYRNVAVLIPCYNEAVTIKKVVEDFKRELLEQLSMSTTTTPQTERLELPATPGQSCAMRAVKARAMSAARCSVTSRQTAT